MKPRNTIHWFEICNTESPEDPVHFAKSLFQTLPNITDGVHNCEPKLGKDDMSLFDIDKFSVLTAVDFNIDNFKTVSK